MWNKPANAGFFDDGAGYAGATLLPENTV